jgi:hypothetical protein
MPAPAGLALPEVERISHVPTHPLVLTWTKIKRLRECPLSMKRAYIDRAPQLSAEVLERGIVVHEWMEDVGRRFAQGEGLSEEDLYRLLLVRAALLGEDAAADSRDIARTVIARDLFPDFPGDAEDVAFEKKWAVDIDFNPCAWDDPRALIRSVFDQAYVENARTLGVVRDFKTNRIIDPEWEQLRIYGWGMLTLVPSLAAVVGELHFLRHGAVRKAPEGLLNPGRLRVEVPIELQAVRADIARRLDEDRWEPRVSKACGTCSFRASCPAFAEKVKPLLVIETEAQAVEAARQLVVLEGQKGDLADALKAWVEARGPIVDGAEQLTFVPVVKKSLTAVREACRTLRQLVGDEAVWSALKLPKANLDKLVRLATKDVKRGEKRAQQEAIVAKLEEQGLFAERTETKFRRVKVGAEEPDNDEADE